MEKGRQNGSDVALRFLKCLCHTLDQHGWWIIRDKTIGVFKRNEMRSLWTGGKNVQYLFAFISAFRLNVMSKHKLGTGLVHARLVAEPQTFERFFDGPTGEHLGNLGDVALRVAAVHTEGVQFQQLATVVFVQSSVPVAFRVWILLGKAAWTAIRPLRAHRSPFGHAYRLRRI